MNRQPEWIRPGANRSPRRGSVPVRAVLFDTYGTVCDFFHPMKRCFEALARAQSVELDAGRLAIDWRNAYVASTYRQAATGSAFRPLPEIQRENLKRLTSERLPVPLDDDTLDALTAVWDRLDPWPDTVPGLEALKELAIIGPLSNGNFADMVNLARHAGLPWDIILGASISGFYKPHPDTYLKSVQALRLPPHEVCMVAAHQRDLAYAAGHGMQTAFVARPDEFGGPVKPAQPELGRDYSSAAEIHSEGEWTFLAESFTDLAAQIRAASRGKGQGTSPS